MFFFVSVLEELVGAIGGGLGAQEGRKGSLGGSKGARPSLTLTQGSYVGEGPGLPKDQDPCTGDQRTTGHDT